MADHAIDLLRESAIEEVVIIGRRGIAQAAHPNSDFLSLASR